MAVRLALLAILSLTASFAWRETSSLVTNVNRPECDGNFYFVIDGYGNTDCITDSCVFTNVI